MSKMSTHTYTPRATHLVEDEEAGQQHTQREYLGAVVHGLVKGVDWDGGRQEGRRRSEWHSKMKFKHNLKLWNGASTCLHGVYMT